MTDREVQAISQFLLKFGHLGCHHITICRPTKEVKQLSRDQIGQAVLDIREAWKREGLDVERLYKVAVLAHQYCADQYACLPGVLWAVGRDRASDAARTWRGPDSQSALSGKDARCPYSATVRT
jgi:hypothetical protein